MRRPDALRFAAVALLRQRSRALVLIMAVSLSVTSVLLLTALGEGARRYVAEQFSSLGKDLLVMFPGRKETTGGLPPVTGNSLREITLDDMHYLGQHQPQLRLVPLVMGFAEAKQGARLRQTMLLGSSNGLRDTHGLDLLSGRWLPGDAAEDRPAVLLGAKVARELFGQAEPVGQWLRFDNRRFRVVGVFTSQSSNLGMDMAEAALIDKIHTDGGAKGISSTEAAMAPVAKRASQRIEAEMAPRGAASAVAAAAGKLAGGLITVGVAGIRALIQASDRPDSEALIRSSLGNTFDKAWIKLVQNPTTGVMAGTLYMAGQIEGNLAGSAQVPSVSSGGSTVDWSPPEATNQQFDPQPYAGE